MPVGKRLVTQILKQSLSIYELKTYKFHSNLALKFLIKNLIGIIAVHSSDGTNEQG